MSMRSRSKVKAVWRAGKNVIELEARGYKGSIFEPVERSCTSTEGMNALEYFLGSLAACITTIMHWHASEVGVTKIDEVIMTLSGEIDLKACAKGDTSIKSGIPEITVEVSVKSPDDPAKIKKAFELAEKLCPISDTIQSPTKINLVLKSDPQK